MTARIIWIFRNNEHSAVAPRSALSAGAAHAARPVVLPQRGRAAPPVLSPVRSSLPARGNLGGSALRAAPLFDATHDVWLVPPSGVKPDAGAAADLRHSDETPCLESPAGSLAPSPAGHLEAISEVLKMAVGLTVFGLVAGVFLVLS